MAVRLFFKDGYHRTPLARVAERLNITKPALYNYFRSKEEIFLRSSIAWVMKLYEASFGWIERWRRRRLTQNTRADPRLCSHHDDGQGHVVRTPRRS